MIWKDRLKDRLKYYLWKNPLGCFLAILHWGIAYKAFTYLPFDTPTDNIAGTELGLLGLFFLFLFDLPAIIVTSIFLLPSLLFVVSDTYFKLVFFFAFFTITFQWFVIGKKMVSFFWKSETENKELQIFDAS